MININTTQKKVRVQIDFRSSRKPNMAAQDSDEYEKEVKLPNPAL